MKSNERYTKEYEKYIRSSEWTIKKNQRKDIDNHKCVMCKRSEGDIRGGLQMHHMQDMDQSKAKARLLHLQKLCQSTAMR